VFLDNASYHHAKLVKQWLSRPGRRIKLHFLPAFCPHLKSDRTTLGGDAQEHHAQQMLRDLRRIRPSDPGFPARQGPQKGGPKYAILSPTISV
jgi:hypothetical protein